MNTNIDATTGSINRNIWRLAWPIMITNLIQVIYNFADTFWVGKLYNSTEAIAAVTVSFSIIFLLLSLAGGLSVATSTLAAQYFGAEEYEKVKTVASTSMILLSIFSLLISVSGIAFNRQLLGLLNTPDNVMPYAIQYFNIILGGMLFTFNFYMLSGLLRGIGNTRTPMIVGIISGIINVILDPLLMFGVGPFPELGIAGAAYATVFSSSIVCFYLLYMLFFGKLQFKLSLKDMKVDLTIGKQLAKIGFPAAITQVVISMGNVAVMGRVNIFGDVAAASHGLGQRLDSLIFMPAMGLSQAASIAVGQNLGANQRDRAMDSGLFAIKLNFFILMGIGLILLLFPEMFLRIFSRDEELIRLGSYYVRYFSLGYAFLGCRIVMNGIFQGAGAAMTAMMLSTVSLWGFRIPLAYALSYTSLGIKGLWLGISISFLISAAFMLYWYKKGTWLDKAVTSRQGILEETTA